MTLTNILLGAVLVGVAALLFFRKRSPEGSSEEAVLLKAQLAQKQEELGVVKASYESEKKERSELQGKNKQLFAEHTKLEARFEALAVENDKLKKKVTTDDLERARREKEFNDRISKLEEAKRALDDEKARVRQEDLDRLKLAEAERDRLWNEHEVNVIARLTDLCKQPQLNFACFSNTNLPTDFDGSLKPDFMIEFQDQYIIFDAKVSKAKSLQTYINETVKSTVQKVKKNPKIYSQIFLVVPTEAAAELKTHYYPLENYTLFVVSPEALPAILACYKRINQYERVEKIDPQERENIVHLIAELDFHIGIRNAADILLATMGTNMLERVENQQSDLMDEAKIKKQEMLKKIPSLSASEMKRLASNLVAQVEATRELTTPKASIKQGHLDVAKQGVIDALS